MKKSLFVPILLFVLLTFSRCEVVGGIFKAGMIWGIFLVVVVVAAIIALVMRSRK